MTDEVPLFPSLVAVMVAEPATTPVAKPLLATVTTPASLLVHDTIRPASTFPAESRGVAVICMVCPGARLTDGGLTLTDATAAGVEVTVTAAVPLFPSLVAVMVAEPAAAPDTNPLPLTLATPELLLAHVTTRPESVFPLASCSVALSWTVWPTVVLTVGGLTLTVATGAAVTVIDAVPFFPSLVAVIVTEPASTPLTSPPPVTVARAGSLLAHVTTRPESAFPFPSREVAVSWTVCPAGTFADGGVTLTVATARGRTRTPTSLPFTV